MTLAEYFAEIFQLMQALAEVRIDLWYERDVSSERTTAY
jgi:hypothetical protein